MSHDEFKQLCTETWKGLSIYLCIDRSKKRDQGK